MTPEFSGTLPLSPRPQAVKTVEIRTREAMMRTRDRAFILASITREHEAPTNWVLMSFCQKGLSVEKRCGARQTDRDGVLGHKDAHRKRIAPEKLKKYLL